MKIKIKKNLFFDQKKPPLLIAEISSNHSGSKKSFLNHIVKAKKAGADLIKIQTYEPEDITIKSSSINVWGYDDWATPQEEEKKNE